MLSSLDFYPFLNLSRVLNMNLTPQGSQIISELALRYYCSEDAVITLFQAVINGGGSMAQFSHPEFGGSGQWMQGGMTMVGDMFNNALKSKVDGLCSELAGLCNNSALFVPMAPQFHGNENSSLFVGNGGGQWWPMDLGSPSSSGSQNQTRYAVFPATQRLAIENQGNLTIYDTLNHQIGGVGQQQGGDASLSFTSQFGLVRLADLPVVSGFGQAQPPPVYSTSPAPESNLDEGDIFAKIERLAELRQKGILSENEFASKKAELMSRL
jgi:hypothetical protein